MKTSAIFDSIVVVHLLAITNTGIKILDPNYLVRFLENLLDGLVGRPAYGSFGYVLSKNLDHLFLHRDE